MKPLKNTGRGIFMSERSPLVSSGYLAPLNLNFSTSDPLAGWKPSAAVEPYVLLREPAYMSRLSVQETLPSQQTLRPDQLGWTTDFARKVRSSLESFSNEWDDPAMDVYDLSETR